MGVVRDEKSLEELRASGLLWEVKGGENLGGGFYLCPRIRRRFDGRLSR